MKDILQKPGTKVALHAAALSGAAALLLYLALTKGWLALLLLPLLLVLMPFLLTAQIWTHVRFARNQGSKELYNLAFWQTVTLVLSFLFVPGVYDTEDTILLGVVRAHQDEFITSITTIATILLFLAFLGITVYQFVILIRSRKHSR